MKEAILAERSGNVETCRAIIHAVLNEGIETCDRERQFIEDLEHYA